MGPGKKSLMKFLLIKGTLLILCLYKHLALSLILEDLSSLKSQTGKESVDRRFKILILILILLL